MAATIFIKFCGFIVHSKTNNMTLSVFPGKSLKLENYFLIYCPSSKHWPTRSNSIYLANISRTFFRFRQTLKIKGSSYKKKKLKISIFSKMAPTILIKFCEFIVHSKPSSVTLSAFPGKMHEIRKLYKLREDK